MTYPEILEGLIKLIIILTFVKAVFEYIKGLKWKRSEFLSKEMKEFFNDSKVVTVCLLLDWNSRKIDIGEKKIVIDDDFLLEALKTHKEKSVFSQDEAHIRDIFDNFFDRLGYLNIYIKSGLVDKKQVDEYLGYYFIILTKKGRKSEKLVATFRNYITYYNFTNAKELLSIK